MIFSLEHLGLAARNTPALRDWYINTLSAELLFSNNENPPAFLLRLPGGAVIEIYPAHEQLEATANNRLAGWRHIALRVDSIETSRAKLESRGVRFEEQPKPAGGGGRVLFFKDEEGNLLHLVERPPGVRY
ncbi:MAG TPA: VOC family protein [Verrucomicrobiae bacterium]|nr:VOC family protein [Verrucomicrobiae bacterium]